MIKRLLQIVVLILIIEFAAFVVYPTVVDQRKVTAEAELIEQYRRAYNKLSARERAEKLNSARAFNDNLMPANLTDVVGESADGGRAGLIAVGGADVICLLDLPGIGLRLAVRPYNAASADSVSAVYYGQTDLPIGAAGDRTLIGINGGSNAQNVVRSIDDIAEGTLFYIDVLGDTLTYRVVSADYWNVDEDSASEAVFGGGTDTARCALMIIPADSSDTYRLFITGELTQDRLTEANDKTQSVSEVKTALILSIPALLAGLVLILVLELLIRLIERYRMKRFKL